MTPSQLTALGVRIDRANEWAPYLDAAMREFGIDKPVRQAMFTAQILHESGLLRWTVEIWGPTPAQSRYEGRKDLGNTKPGDGIKFLGRGPLQITGRGNYTLMAVALRVPDLLDHPEKLGQPELGSRAAAHFWKSRKLNELADTRDVERVTRVINGGINGLADRIAFFNAATGVFK